MGPAAVVRAALAAFLIAVLSSAQCLAQSDRIIADFTWNGVAQPRALVVLRDGDALISTRVLEQFGVAAKGRCLQTIEGACFVSLNALRPAVTYQFDMQNLELKVQTAAALLPRTTVKVMTTPAPYSDDFAAGASMNYSLRSDFQNAWTGSFDARYAWRRNAVFETTAGRSLSGNIERGLSSLTFDAPGAMRRAVLGDTMLSAGPLDGAGIIAGISVQREFSLDPYEVTFPTPSLRTTVTRPSQADVYVNGALVKSIDLPPGVYNLTDIPIVSGYSDARVVVRDEFGARSNDLLQYGATSLLRPGLTDYHYSVGLIRGTHGPNGYGTPAASAFYRIGTGSQATFGGALQATPGDFTASFQMDRTLGFGVLESSVAASRGNDGTGDAFSIAYGNSGRHSATGIEAQWQSASYRKITDSAQFETILADAAVSQMERLGAGTTVSFIARYSKYLREGIVRSASVALTQRLGAWDLTAQYTRGMQSSGLSRRISDIAISINRSLNGRDTQTMQYDSASGDSTMTVSHTNNSPLGVSYRAGADAHGAVPFVAAVDAGLPFATVHANAAYMRHEHAPSGSLEVDGGVVYGERHLFFSQPVGDGYAIVDAAGLGGASLSLDGQTAGKTGRAGYALLPWLASNQANSIGISNAGLPLEDIVDANERRVGPGYHAGTLVHFSTQRVHALYGRVQILAGGATRIPAYGEIDLLDASGKTLASSPIDDEGRFFLERVSEGTYHAAIADVHGECDMTLNVANFNTPSHDVGTLVCGR